MISAYWLIPAIILSAALGYLLCSALVLASRSDETDRIREINRSYYAQGREDEREEHGAQGVQEAQE